MLMETNDRRWAAWLFSAALGLGAWACSEAPIGGGTSTGASASSGGGSSGNGSTASSASSGTGGAATTATSSSGDQQAGTGGACASSSPGVIPEPPQMACDASMDAGACEFPASVCADAKWLIYYDNPKCIDGFCRWEAVPHECPNCDCVAGGCMNNITAPAAP
jgi:hypothetical protein